MGGSGLTSTNLIKAEWREERYFYDRPDLSRANLDGLDLEQASVEVVCDSQFCVELI